MKNLSQWKTTIIGLLGVVVAFLVGFNVLKPEDTQAVTTQSTEVVNAVFALISGITGLIAIFAAKDKVE